MVQEQNNQSFEKSTEETEKTFDESEETTENVSYESEGSSLEGSENDYSGSGEDGLKSSGIGDISGDYEYYYDDSGDGQGSGNDYGSEVKIHSSLRMFRSKGGNSLPGNLLDTTNKA